MRPPMVAGPMLRNFRFFRTASCAVCATALPVNRTNNRRALADFMTVSGDGPFYPIRWGLLGGGLEAVAEGRMAWELRWYWPRKSAASPRRSAKPAVARQCWPKAWLYSALRYAPCAVLPHDGFERHAAIDVDGVAGARHYGARESTHGREAEGVAMLRGHLAGVSGDQRPLARLTLELQHPERVVIGLRIGGREVSRFALRGPGPRGAAASAPYMRICG